MNDYIEGKIACLHILGYNVNRTQKAHLRTARTEIECDNMALDIIRGDDVPYDGIEYRVWCGNI